MILIRDETVPLRFLLRPFPNTKAAREQLGVYPLPRWRWLLTEAENFRVCPPLIFYFFAFSAIVGRLLFPTAVVAGRAIGDILSRRWTDAARFSRGPTGEHRARGQRRIE